MSGNVYMSDEEYGRCWVEFWGLRREIASSLTTHGLGPGSRVLDVLSGHGLFAVEVARLHGGAEVHAMGLRQDMDSFVGMFGGNVGSTDGPVALDGVTYHVMDATDLDFPSGHFDLAVNFLGLEDVNMTRGRDGVRLCLSEMARVTKPGGVVLITVCIEGDAPDQRLATEVALAIGHGAVFHPKEFYAGSLVEQGVTVLDERWYQTGRKMTAKQAREEIEYACNQTPVNFARYDVRTVPFEEIWRIFGGRCEEHGMAYYSELCVLIGRVGGG